MVVVGGQTELRWGRRPQGALGPATEFWASAVGSPGHHACCLETMRLWLWWYQLALRGLNSELWTSPGYGGTHARLTWSHRAHQSQKELELPERLKWENPSIQPSLGNLETK